MSLGQGILENDFFLSPLPPRSFPETLFTLLGVEYGMLTCFLSQPH